MGFKFRSRRRNNVSSDPSGLVFGEAEVEPYELEQSEQPEYLAPEEPEGYSSQQRRAQPGAIARSGAKKLGGAFIPSLQVIAPAAPTVVFAIMLAWAYQANHTAWWETVRGLPLAGLYGLALMAGFAALYKAHANKNTSEGLRLILMGLIVAGLVGIVAYYIAGGSDFWSLGWVVAGILCISGVVIAVHNAEHRRQYEAEVDSRNAVLFGQVHSALDAANQNHYYTGQTGSSVMGVLKQLGEMMDTIAPAAAHVAITSTHLDSLVASRADELAKAHIAAATAQLSSEFEAKTARLHSEFNRLVEESADRRFDELLRSARSSREHARVGPTPSAPPEPPQPYLAVVSPDDEANMVW